RARAFARARRRRPQRDEPAAGHRARCRDPELLRAAARPGPVSLEALLEPLACSDAPGLVVSVRRHGRTLLRRGLGLANLETGTANTPATRMRIASTSKHFVCALLLRLQAEGRLRLDEPVARWLPELPPAQGRRTLRQLMSHTGGIRDFLDLSLLSNGT